jgi:hypothetical protein
VIAEHLIDLTDLLSSVGSRDEAFAEGQRGDLWWMAPSPILVTSYKG